MQHPEENFDALRRALKLKRHEQPPPRYFNDFSARIISRIRENDVHDRANRLDAAAWEAPWVNRILEMFQARPIYAGLIGAAACFMMIGGIIYSERPAATPAISGNTTLGNRQDFAGVGLLNAADPATLNSSASPIGALPAGTTLFDRIRPLQTAPVFTTTNLLK